MTLELPVPPAGGTRLILVRHGEPAASVHGRCYGRLDPRLSAVGRRQMRRTWRLLAGHPPATIYSSPSRRALDSAALHGNTRSGLRIENDLREIDFGVFEGLTYDDIAARYPADYRAWMTCPTAVTFPGGESFPAMSARVSRTLDRIVAAHAGGVATVVSHGGVNRVALAAALALQPSAVFRLAQAYACVNVIDYLRHQPIVQLVNATAGPC